MSFSSLTCAAKTKTIQTERPENNCFPVAPARNQQPVVAHFTCSYGLFPFVLQRHYKYLQLTHYSHFFLNFVPHNHLISTPTTQQYKEVHHGSRQIPQPHSSLSRHGSSCRHFGQSGWRRCHYRPAADIEQQQCAATSSVGYGGAAVATGNATSTK